MGHIGVLGYPIQQWRLCLRLWGPCSKLAFITWDNSLIIGIYTDASAQRHAFVSPLLQKNRLTNIEFSALTSNCIHNTVLVSAPIMDRYCLSASGWCHFYTNIRYRYRYIRITSYLMNIKHFIQTHKDKHKHTRRDDRYEQTYTGEWYKSALRRHWTVSYSYRTLHIPDLIRTLLPDTVR